MAGLSLRHIYKVYPAATKKSKKSKKSGEGRRTGDYLAVRDFNMEIEDGEFIVFVGPSGCGKSTTLRMIAGLESITAGDLYIDGRFVNDIDAKDRDIAMVFQNYALYPHMTAGENIAFGLKMRKIPVEKKDKDGNVITHIDTQRIKEAKKKLAEVEKEIATADEIFKEGLESRKKELEADIAYYSANPVPVYKYVHMNKKDIAAKVKWAAEVLGVTELLDNKPKAMSGGQRQRIALGRAIVREPKVMLLDEPLSNLDAKLRTAMRSEIVKLHDELKTTFIYVTHDQIEAMTMGTRIVVMKLGVVQQIDSPTNLFDYPDNKFVAGFIGTPQMNFFDVTIQKEATKLKVTFENGETQLYSLSKMRTFQKEFVRKEGETPINYLDGKEHKVVLGIRGENIKVSEKGISTKLVIKEILGNTTQMFVKLDGCENDIIICANERNNAKNDDEIKIEFDETRMHFFDKESELSILERKFGNK